MVLSWDVGPQWQLETEPDNTSEVEVRFIASPHSTRVELEHRNIDRHGQGCGRRPRRRPTVAELLSLGPWTGRVFGVGCGVVMNGKCLPCKEDSGCLDLEFPSRRKALEVKLLDAWSRATVEFDDPNLVSYAGVAPVLALAERAGLSELIEERVRIDPAATKVPSAGVNPAGS